MSTTPELSQLHEALKAVAVTLKQAEVRFALGGGFAAWARGGPAATHDVDFLVVSSDRERAEAALREDGLRVEHPPEDWLFKVFRDDAMVDVIHHLGGEPVGDEHLDDADVLEVLSVRMPVISATQVMAQRLCAMDEHMCDLAPQVAAARALREQVDWTAVRRKTSANDFAAATLFLLERLRIIPAAT